MVFSVRLSICLSVRLSVCPSVTPFWLCSHHRIFMKFSGVITTDQGKVHANGQGQTSKVKVTEVTTQLYRFRTVTPVWIHIWWWNDTYNLMLLRRGALLFFKVIRQISAGHTVQSITDFDPNSAFLDYWPVAAFKSLRFALLKIIHQMSRSHGTKSCWFGPKLNVSGL